MIQYPTRQPDSTDEANHEGNPAAAAALVFLTFDSGIESTIVCESAAEWSLGLAPSMLGREPPHSASSDLKELTAAAVIGNFQVQRVLGTGVFATVDLAVSE